MCIALLAYGCVPGTEWILLTNRDEFQERPSTPAHFWNSHPDLLGGKDLKEGGMWLGLSRKGRMGMITNFRDPAAIASNKKSRGAIVTEYLSSGKQAALFGKDLLAEADTYNPFNFLFLDEREAFVLSSRRKELIALKPGIYTLSNAHWDTEWPKTRRLNELAVPLLDQKTPLSRFLDVLGDKTKAPDKELPSTGIPLEMERLVSSIFIQSARYGTRCSSVLVAAEDGSMRMAERSFNAQGHPTQERYFRFTRFTRAPRS